MSAALGIRRKKILVLLCKCQDTKLNIKVGGVVVTEKVSQSAARYLKSPGYIGRDASALPKIPVDTDHSLCHSLVPCPVHSRSRLSLEWLIFLDVSESMV